MKKSAFVVDIDGVLADSVKDEFKLDFLQGDFTKFEAEIPTFDSFEWAIDVVRAIAKKHHIVFITARNEAYKEATEKWLRKHIRIKKDQYDIYMRRANDRRNDTQVKAEVLPKILERYEVLAAFDDNLDNAKLFSYFGIKSCYVL